ncbi:MAG TPA: ABC transporter substrate-binding protein, partial [Candidatus Nitrosocosmicus sp.]|nr:ABC transporter substrate-binding protein [Candidatus Nitrosocosmicus sp.]
NEAGYVEGKNLLLEMPIKESYDELRPIAKAYSEQRFNAVVTFGGTATLIAKELTKDVPVIFVGISDPVRLGIVKSEARPETNMTGLTNRPDVEIHGKRLEVFKQVVPTLRRVTVLYNARGDNPQHARSLAAVQKVAPTLGLQLSERPIKSASDIEQTLSWVSGNPTDGLFPICTSLFLESFKNITTFTMQKRLPVMGCSASDVSELSALLSYDSDRYRLGQRAGAYVGRILKGIKPQDLPVEAPTYFALVINLKTAKQIGLTIPVNVLERANRMIK